MKEKPRTFWSVVLTILKVVATAFLGIVLHTSATLFFDSSDTTSKVFYAIFALGCLSLIFLVWKKTIASKIHSKSKETNTLPQDSEQVPISEPTTPTTSPALSFDIGEPLPPHLQEDYERVKQYERLSPNPKFHQSEKDEELSFQFFYKYGDVSTKKSDEFEALYRKAFATDDLQEKIQYLKEAILKFEEVKQWHYKKSKGAMIYFNEMWECMHNSQNSCFSWVETAQDTLEDYEEEYHYIIPEILKVIGSNDGILQKDIYSFIECDKSRVQSILKKLAESEQIVRSKKGSTYELTLK